MKILRTIISSLVVALLLGGCSQSEQEKAAKAENEKNKRAAAFDDATKASFYTPTQNPKKY